LFKLPNTPQPHTTTIPKTCIIANFNKPMISTNFKRRFKAFNFGFYIIIDFFKMNQLADFALLKQQKP
jgi:hypothetical protein